MVRVILLSGSKSTVAGDTVKSVERDATVPVRVSAPELLIVVVKLCEPVPAAVSDATPKKLRDEADKLITDMSGSTHGINTSSIWGLLVP